MARVVLYHSPYSPFSRSVLLLIKYLELDVDVKILDLMEEDQMSPEFRRINPQHCVGWLQFVSQCFINEICFWLKAFYSRCPQ